jgi:hypothetical protein
METNNKWVVEFSKLDNEQLLEKFNEISEKLTNMIAIDDINDLMDQQDAIEQIMIDKGIMDKDGQLK